MTASLDGSRTSKVLPLAAGIQAPSISSVRGWARNCALAGAIADRSFARGFCGGLVTTALFILDSLELDKSCNALIWSASPVSRRRAFCGISPKEQGY